MKKRCSNIEALRIISMLMILMLHLLNYGRLLEKSNVLTAKGFCIWFLEALCFVAVNCYVIIGGYFLVDSNFKIKRILKIWSETLFYSILIYSIFYFTIYQEKTVKETLINFFPVFLRNYWFVTVYIVLLILSPFLNKLINSLSQKQYTYLIAIIIICFSLWATIVEPVKTINYGGGYSISWFICLYLIAGYLKKYYKNAHNRKNVYLIIYFLMSFMNVLAHFLIKKFSITVIKANFLYSYYSITVVIASVSLFLYF